MKKFSGIIILLVLQLLSFYVLTFDTLSIIALWGILYLVIFYRKSLNLDAVSDSVNPYCFKESSTYVKNDCEGKLAESYYSPIKIKWFYLLLALINGGVVYYLIATR